MKSFPSCKSVKVMGVPTAGTDPKWHFLFNTVFNSHSFLVLLKQLVG